MAAENIAEVEVEVQNRLGLHARPASLLVRKAMEYSCELSVGRDGEFANLRSLMNILMLAAGKGTRLVIRASGEDAETAVCELRDLINSKFGED